MCVKKLLIGLLILSLASSSCFSLDLTYNPFDQAEIELDNIESRLSKSEELLKMQEQSMDQLQKSYKELSSQYRDLERSYKRSERSRRLWKLLSMTLTASTIGVIAYMEINNAQ